MKGTATERIHVTDLRRMMAAAIGVPEQDDADVRWRLTQLHRHDWPDTLAADSHLRRGHTPRQALRVLAAMAFLHARYGPTDAVTLARENENALLAIMATSLAPDLQPGRLLAVHRPGAMSPEGTAGGTARSVLPTTPADIVAGMEADGDRRPWTVIDLAAMARRAVDALPGKDGGPSSAWTDLLREAVIATADGKGFVASDVPAGDRYKSPRRKRGEEAADAI